MIFALYGNVHAEKGPCWIEIQKDWQISGMASPGETARGPDQVISIFHALQNRNIAPSNAPITAKTVLARPRSKEISSLYIRTDTAVSASLNGTELPVTVLSDTECLYEVPGHLWKDINTITLQVTPGKHGRGDSIMPAVYLTCPDGTERLRHGIIRITSDDLDRGTTDLNGPVFLKVLSEDEYRNMTKDPEEFEIDHAQCAVIQAPSTADHVPGVTGSRHLTTEFSFVLEKMPSRPLCLYIDTISGPDEAYFDGHRIGSTGTAGDPRRLYYDRIRVYPIPERYLEPGSLHRVTILSGRSTDYLFGTIEGNALRIGYLDTELRDLHFHETMAIAIVAIYFTIGLYYGLLFLQRRENREHLFYAFTALCLSSYFFLRTQTKYLIFDDFFILKRVEYIVLFLLLPFMSLFMHNFFVRRGTITEKLFRGAIYAYLAVSAILVLLPVISSDISYWNAILPFVQATWLVPIIYVVYLMTRETFYYIVKLVLGRRGAEVNVPSAPRDRWNRMAGALPGRLADLVRAQPAPFMSRVMATGPDGALMISAVFIMIAAAVHDILLDRDIITGARLSSYGTLLFILGVAGILSIRILKLYRQVGTLNRDLTEAVNESNRRADHLAGIISGVDVASKDLVSVSSELTAIERNFSSLAEEQSASSKDMRKTFDELTASITAISKSAGNQEAEGKKTSDIIETFNRTQSGATGMINSVLGSISGISESKRETERIINEMIGKMQVINDGGAAIKNFVEIINDISDRINLLSLNASIEAARAGEHGRGFAVVADEIGKLATATSDNSKEISSQISRILNDINEGMHMVDITRSSTEAIFSVLDEINSRIDQVETMIESQAGAFDDVIRQASIINSLSGEIAGSTVEQMKSMESSARAVKRLSEIADEVAALNRRILTFTETISEKARELNRLIEEKN
ncbi:MAG TPA: methyl-accepting chemotaxis protein [Spirochaetota bacterium]|nr:methyl-accepting chemotaxis protein [Spirochaetota bacterium]HPC41943.1 methyl-accepting chemotaxis protein [Spirochaetota bacterium]HPL17023.1 methyl-accepting chemotaxis protein [Spirochaetota bacterium]HQF07012.1 methyl-accepting chemotaxis protein [Spirochaetota bacterium]HQH95749.1 methyl-accepting chemotaxis protein [Spirochaetota bacterium]